MKIIDKLRAAQEILNNARTEEPGHILVNQEQWEDLMENDPEAPDITYGQN